MKKFWNKSKGVILLYVVAILLAFVLTSRVDKLESREDFRNQNNSVVLKVN